MRMLYWVASNKDADRTIRTYNKKDCFAALEALKATDPQLLEGFTAPVQVEVLYTNGFQLLKSALAGFVEAIEANLQPAERDQRRFNGLLIEYVTDEEVSTDEVIETLTEDTEVVTD